tara:strand:+ start:142 stop:288 length:147 start_codon:yes stop_codon:yes gene_type:complete
MINVERRLSCILGTDEKMLCKLIDPSASLINFLIILPQLGQLSAFIEI